MSYSLKYNQKKMMNDVKNQLYLLKKPITTKHITSENFVVGAV